MEVCCEDPELTSSLGRTPRGSVKRKVSDVAQAAPAAHKRSSDPGMKPGFSGCCVKMTTPPNTQRIRWKVAHSSARNLGRYHELRRDRGRWVGYVREAGGNKWSQFAGTAPRKRAWTTPRRAERASRHGPETAQTLLSQRREWERSVLPLVRYNSGEPGVLRCYLAVKSAGRGNDIMASLNRCGSRAREAKMLALTLLVSRAILPFVVPREQLWQFNPACLVSVLIRSVIRSGISPGRCTRLLACPCGR
ncbi:unnamed protein product [Tetraodon nigroviridis]|uniref:(spotted green pufferfish) hypothetical protein n=1 Tax=Tetraodon nigroviridis TaxID=99883 RepID=Q4RTL3_TETNG|nr:unnamed protein product [Tetraodon nigroviridis]